MLVDELLSLKRVRKIAQEQDDNISNLCEEKRK